MYKYKVLYKKIEYTKIETLHNVKPNILFLPITTCNVISCMSMTITYEQQNVTSISFLPYTYFYVYFYWHICVVRKDKFKNNITILVDYE